MTKKLPAEGSLRSFLPGALILSLSGILSRLCGAIFRIPLTNLVGPQAMGYFGSAYSVYNFLLALATSGIPTGISAMVARAAANRRHGDIPAVMGFAAAFFLSFSGIVTLLGVSFARPLAVLMNSEEAFYCVLAIVPAVFFITVVALIRGFFQGYRNMVPTALSNLIEAALKLVAGYGFAFVLHLRGYSPSVVVGGAMMGVTLGTVISALFMVLRYLLRGKQYRIPAAAGEKTPRRLLIRDFFAVTFPVILSAVTVNLMGALDACFVVNRMKPFFGVDGANFRWGCYGSMAMTLFNLPSFLLVSVGTSLIPSVSAARARKDVSSLRATVDSALSLSAVLAFGCGFGLSAVSEGAITLFYGGQSAEAITLSSRLLSVLSPALVCVGLTNVTASVLQGVGKAQMSVVSVAVGSVIKTIVAYVTVAIPRCNVFGAPLSTNLAYPVMLALNLAFLKKYAGVTPSFSEILFKPLVSALGCWGAVVSARPVLFAFFGVPWSVFAEIALGGVVYIALLFLLKQRIFCVKRKTFKK